MATNPSPAPNVAVENVPEPHPSLQRPPTGAPGGPELPPTIALTLPEYHRLRDVERQLNDFHESAQKDLEAKEQARIQVLAEKGQIEEALKQQRAAWEQKHAEATSKFMALESQVLEERLDTVFTKAFMGRECIGQTAEQKALTAAMLINTLKSEFIAEREPSSGSIVTIHKPTRRPAADVLKEMLDSPLYSQYFAPTVRGGSGSDASRPPAIPVVQGSLQDFANAWRAQQGHNDLAVGFRPVRK